MEEDEGVKEYERERERKDGSRVIECNIGRRKGGRKRTRQNVVNTKRV